MTSASHEQNTPYPTGASKGRTPSGPGSGPRRISQDAPRSLDRQRYAAPSSAFGLICRATGAVTKTVPSGSAAMLASLAPTSPTSGSSTGAPKGTREGTIADGTELLRETSVKSSLAVGWGSVGELQPARANAIRTITGASRIAADPRWSLLA